MNPAESKQEVRFQLRRDLQFADYPVGLSHQTVIKDPLKMEYFLFDTFEFAMLELLRQPRSLSDLKELADQKFAEARIEVAELKRFMKRLMSDNLIVAETTGMGSGVLLTREKMRRAKWMQSIFSILAIRFRGVNPQSFLDFLNPISKHLFRPAFLIASLVAFVVAMVTMLLNANLVFESEHLWQSMQQVRILIPIALALMVVKILHELGHAMSCRSIGRECNEMGVLLLAFIPCLYCNVSDVWMEPKRWKRMLVSSAGIYVEMLIAAICVPLWLMSNSGELQLFWFTLMTICSVNTILINGNPLLRYDGYYLLSDAVGIPNLYMKAQAALQDRIGSFFVSQRQAKPFSWLEVYGAAAFLYRYFIVGVIVFTIYLFFAQMQLATFGLLVAMVIGTMTLAGTAWGSARKLMHLGQSGQLRRGRVGWTLVVVIAILFAGLLVPIRTSIYSDGEVAFEGNRILFAPESGEIHWEVEAGQSVTSGDLVATIRSRELELKIQEQKLYVGQAEKTLENQQLLLSQGADNIREIELQKQAVSSAKKIQDELLSQQKQLELVAEVGGKVVSLPGSIRTQVQDGLNLRREISTLHNQIRNAFVQAGEPIAVVSNGDASVIQLHVSERSVNRVAVGQKVKLLINQYSPEVLLGTVSDIAIDTPDDSVAIDGTVSPDASTVVVTAKLDQSLEPIFLNSKARAVILGEWISVYEMLSRLLAENFS